MTDDGLRVAIGGTTPRRTTMVDQGARIQPSEFLEWMNGRISGVEPSSSLTGKDGSWRRETTVFEHEEVYQLPEFGVVIDGGGNIFKETISEALFRFPELQMLPNITGEQAPVFTPPNDAIDLEDASIFFAYGGMRNPAHFLIDCLSSITAIQRCGIAKNFISPVLSKYHRDMLSLLGVQVTEIKSSAVRIRRVVWTNCMDQYLRVPNKSLLQVREAILRRSGEVHGHHKVYLSRRKIKNRILLNESDVESALRGQGFSIVYPEELTAIQQIAAVRDADVIVGPTGAQMVNCLFAKPGARVVEIQPTNFPAIWIRNMCHLLGLDWRCVLTQSPIRSSLREIGGRKLENFLFEWKADIEQVVGAACADHL